MNLSTGSGLISHSNIFFPSSMLLLLALTGIGFFSTFSILWTLDPLLFVSQTFCFFGLCFCCCSWGTILILLADFFLSGSKYNDLRADINLKHLLNMLKLNWICLRLLIHRLNDGNYSFFGISRLLCVNKWNNVRLNVDQSCQRRKRKKSIHITKILCRQSRVLLKSRKSCGLLHNFS